MSLFRIKYNLPDGTLVGYHADSFCSITSIPERAKTHNGPEEKATEWLEIVRRNFKSIWEGNEEYRIHPCWKGCEQDQVRLTVEETT